MVLSTQTVNVIRYSALGAGLVYGIWHQRTITAQTKARQAQHEYARKEALIAQAKAEWAKNHLPKGRKTESGDLITDPSDPRFDLEAFLAQLSADEKKSSL